MNIEVKLNQKTFNKIQNAPDKIVYSVASNTLHRSYNTIPMSNEKYKGHVLLQKTYVSNFFTGKRATNNGELPKYLLEGHHEAIIKPDEFPTF